MLGVADAALRDAMAAYQAELVDMVAGKDARLREETTRRPGGGFGFVPGEG